MNNPLGRLTPDEAREIETKILQGVVNRASTLAFLFAIAFSTYAITSFDFLSGFYPDLSFFDNAWPRLAFNGIPLLLLGFYLRRFKERTTFKAWLWTAALSLVFLAACLIYVWPLIWAGRTEVYLYVHSANMFVLTTALIVVAPPPRFLVAQNAGYVMLFLIPISFLFYKNGDFKMLRFMWGDFAIALPIAAFVALLIHQLRLKIALFDFELKRLAAPFLGSTLTDAIYNQKTELLKNRIADATLIQIDIRGYTKFYRDNDPGVVKSFMTEFHHIVNRFVARHGGYWHKSLGDAHIFSFGAMDWNDDLKQLNLESKELSTALLRRKRHHIESAIVTIREMVVAFYELKRKYDVDEVVGLGVGIASGEVEIRVQGDEARKELDIDGAAVIRAARLEEYSKNIRSNLATNCSVIVVSPELAVFLENDPSFKRWETVKQDKQVRDFAEIQFVYFSILEPTQTGAVLKGAA